MRYTSIAVVLGTLVLLAVPVPVEASNPAANSFLYGGTNGPNCIAALTCRLHQHGPLYNYGPYYGYPPFEPYGPWNAYLQYNPWYYGMPNGGGGCCNKDCSVGDISGHGPLCPGWSCLNCCYGCSNLWHSCWSNGGWFHGCSSCCHGGLFTGCCGWCHPCKSCANGSATPAAQTLPLKQASFNPATTDPVSRYSGAGNAQDFAHFYSGLPSLTLTGGVAK